MIKATKSTIRKLKELAEHYTWPSVLLCAIEQAEEDLKVFKDCQKHDCMDEYYTHWGYNGGRAYYSDGLIYRPDKDGESGNITRGWAYKYPGLIRYTLTHDLNFATVSDINKLVKTL